jgi:hypothetical protein
VCEEIKTNESKKAKTKRKQTTRAHPFNKGSEKKKTKTKQPTKS